MKDYRLGDIIDDHCIKCRRVTNHAIVSLVNAEPAKVRCRTCYHDHDYRHEQAPPSKKDLKKAELFKEVLAAAVPGAVIEDVTVSEDGAVTEEVAVAEDIAGIEDVALAEDIALAEMPVPEEVAAETPAPAKAVKKTATRGKKA